MKHYFESHVYKWYMEVERLESDKIFAQGLISSRQVM
jgi:hypothetical protein